jgi:small subunit ribosomal protein S2
MLVLLAPQFLVAVEELEGYEISCHSCKKVIFFCKINIARKTTNITFGPSKGHVGSDKKTLLSCCILQLNLKFAWREGHVSSYLLTYSNFFPNEISFSSRPTEPILLAAVFTLEKKIEKSMDIEKLLEAGVHFGHRVTKWNPRMAPFIYGERNGIHILDVIQTMNFLEETSQFLEKFKNEPSTRTFAKPKEPFSGRKKSFEKPPGKSSEDVSKSFDSTKPGSSAPRSRKKDVLFVGTKKQASQLIEKASNTINGYPFLDQASENADLSQALGNGLESKNSKIMAHYVNHRWLGGLLTNWSTMKICIQQLNDLEKRNSAGEFENLPKKERSNLKKDYEKLMKFFGGIKNLKDIPDLVFIIGQDSEMNAVRECLKIQKTNPMSTKVADSNKSGSPASKKAISKDSNGLGQGLRTITLLDTNCDPELADLFIPANDDSAKSLTILLDQFTKVLSE